MGWGERRTPSPGTDQQIADAHAALDVVGIRPGPLAIRALEAASKIDWLQNPPTAVSTPATTTAAPPPNGAYC